MPELLPVSSAPMSQAEPWGLESPSISVFVMAAIFVPLSRAQLSVAARWISKVPSWTKVGEHSELCVSPLLLDFQVEKLMEFPPFQDEFIATQIVVGVVVRVPA